MWKILSGISGACLAVALFFAFSSRNDISVEREVEARSKANFKTVKNHHKKADETLSQKNTQLAGLKTDRDKLKKDVASADEESKTKEASLETAKKSLEETSKQLAAVQKQIDDAGDVEKLVAQVQALQNEKKTEESAVAAESAKVAAIQEKQGQLQTQLEKLRTVESNSRKGVIEPTFTATIAQAFSDWGFAVLNKGNNGGVIANAELEVKRGKNIVARLKVRNVEQAISVADIVPGSVPVGYSIRSGDQVVAAPVTVAEKKMKDTPNTPVPAKGAPPAPPAKTDDPFGAPPAKGAAPAMGSDPFGAPAAPAPAPAAAAPPAAPGMASDPFGTPAATPPPAAAGAGTKASPSTADPFAK